MSWFSRSYAEVSIFMLDFRALNFDCWGATPVLSYCVSVIMWPGALLWLLVCGLMSWLLPKRFQKYHFVKAKAWSTAGQIFQMGFTIMSKTVIWFEHLLRGTCFLHFFAVLINYMSSKVAGLLQNLRHSCLSCATLIQMESRVSWSWVTWFVGRAKIIQSWWFSEVSWRLPCASTGASWSTWRAWLRNDPLRTTPSSLQRVASSSSAFAPTIGGMALGSSYEAQCWPCPLSFLLTSHRCNSSSWQQSWHLSRGF